MLFISRKIKLLALVSILFLASRASATPAINAKDAKDADSKLAGMLQKIAKEKQENDVDYDKLQAANDALLAYLKGVSVQMPVARSPLKMSVENGLSVIDSDDKKLRCYSWDTQTGGTMHVFYSLIAYDAGNGVWKCKVLNPSGKDSDGDPGAAFEAVHTIKTKDGKTVYLVCSLFIGSGIIHGRTAQAYIISNGKLGEERLFQAGKKQLDSISFEFAEYVDGTDFEISADKKTFKVPLIKPAPPDSAGSGEATGKYLTYTFDGYKFVFTGKK